MRKYLLHVLIISFVFLLAPTAHVASHAEAIEEASALLPGLTLHKENDSVVVFDIKKVSKTWEAGIRKGDKLLKINDQEMETLDDYVKKTKSISSNKIVTLLLSRHGEKYVIIKDGNNFQEGQSEIKQQSQKTTKQNQVATEKTEKKKQIFIELSKNKETLTKEQTGYYRSGNECRPMTIAELNQQKELVQTILKQLQERRSIGVSGGDCEWEYESGAQVCVTVTDVSLDCRESYDGDNYRSCEVVVDYEVSTDYRGDDYLSVEVECTVDIRYKRRDFYSWRSDSDYDTEDHSLYYFGSDSGDMSFDFSFRSYEEVYSVKIDSAECEINSVYKY